MELADSVVSLMGSEQVLPSGLRALAEESRPGIARSLVRLAELVEMGRPLEEALRAPGVGLPDSVVALLEAGLRGGDPIRLLDGVFGEASLGAELRRRIQVELVYPTIVLGTGLVVMGTLIGPILGKLRGVFLDFGMNLPWASAMILGLSHRFSEPGAGVVWMLLGVVILVVVLIRLLLTAEERRWLMLSMPIVGRVGRHVAAASLCRVLAVLLEARLPLPEAVRLAGPATEDPFLAKACERAAARIEAGEDWSAVVCEGLFPPGFRGFVAWAQGSGDLVRSLRLAGAVFEARARAEARHAMAILKLLAVSAVIWWVLLVAVGFLLPCLELLRGLSA
ncbi:MAG: type II secretion system protein GspF [Isosphaeraceae bacterium]|jgi:type II secretory pathway component PulF|nr:MAG: type II secretion system protein GspF [Isosphaeraceae bacterium]